MPDDKRVNLGAAATVAALSDCFASPRRLTTVGVSSRTFSRFLCAVLCLNSFLGLLLFLFLLSLQACHSLPLSVALHTPPPLPFLSFPLGSSAKVGWQTEANTAQGRAEGDPKAGELIMCTSVFLTPLCWRPRVFDCFGCAPLTVT